MDKLYAILTGQATQPAQPTHKAEAPELSTSSANVPAMDETNLQTAESLEKIKGWPLPNATPGGLAGLLDVVAEHPDGIDLADLASDLSFEVDDLFPLVDAGTLLHVIVVRDGHVQITEAGDAWHQADILRAKQVFASLAMEHVPLVRNIEHALRHASGGHCVTNSYWICCTRGIPTRTHTSSSPSPWNGAVTANCSITMPTTTC